MLEPPANTVAGSPADGPGSGKTPVCSSLQTCRSVSAAFAASEVSSGSTPLLHSGRSMLQRVQVGAENIAASPLLNGTHGSAESASRGADVAVANRAWTCSRPSCDSGLD